VTADHFTALRAAPFSLFLLEKFFHAGCSDQFEIFDHAHVVFSPVTLIDGFQPLAGIVLALEAKSHPAFPQQFTLLSHMSAVFPSRDTARAVCLVKPLLIQVFYHELISNAQAAIHPAGSNQNLIHLQKQPRICQTACDANSRCQ